VRSAGEIAFRIYERVRTDDVVGHGDVRCECGGVALRGVGLGVGVN